jgi:hypothetical protein
MAKTAKKHSPMEGTLAYTISAAIVGFGILVFVDGLNSGAPFLSACAALIPFAIGLVSAFGDH